MDTPEIEVFSRAGVSPTALRAWMIDNDLAVLSCRNVTTRDAADTQQPTSLRIEGGIETLAPGDGPVYTVSALQFFQADYVRGYGLNAGTALPIPAAVSPRARCMMTRGRIQPPQEARGM